MVWTECPSSIFPSFLECSVFPPLSVSTFPLKSSFSSTLRVYHLSKFLHLLVKSLPWFSYLLTFLPVYSAPFGPVNCCISTTFYGFLYAFQFLRVCILLMTLHFTAYPFTINCPDQGVSLVSHTHPTLSGSGSLICGCCCVSVWLCIIYYVCVRHL